MPLQGADRPAGDLLRLSEQYQDPVLMHELVNLRFCPPDDLQIIFTKTVKNSEMPMSGPIYWTVEDTFLQLARRADTPPEVLGKLLNVTKSPDVRLAALKNPRVARSEKVAYERTLCAKPMPGDHYFEEFQFAAADADAPLQLLQCLAADRPDTVSISSGLPATMCRRVCPSSSSMAMKVRPSASSMSAESQCVVGKIIGKELEGNVTTELQVLGFVNYTHAPATKLLDDAIVRDGLADHAKECYG